MSNAYAHRVRVRRYRRAVGRITAITLAASSLCGLVVLHAWLMVHQ